MDHIDPSTRPLNVLIIASKFPYPPMDGGCIATLNLAIGLADNGVRVTVLAMSTPKHRFAEDQVPERVRTRINLIPSPVPTSINYLHLAFNYLFSKEPYIYVRFIHRKFNEHLRAILADQRFDVVQLEGLYLMPYAPTIRQHSQARLAYRPHNLEHEVWFRNAHNQASPIRQHYFNSMAVRLLNLERSLVNRYDLLVPISERDLQHFQSIGNTKPSIAIPAGFPPYRLPRHEHLDREAELNDLGFIGALDWIPNQDGLIWFLDHIWPALMEADGTPRQLHVAGRNAPGWLTRRLQETPQVEYCGEVPNAQEFMMRFPILIVPLNSGGGMRVKIVEAMMLGRIVITTSTGAEGIKARSWEHLIIANTAQEYVEALARLSADRPLLCALSKNASLFAIENYCYDKLAKELIAFYQHNL